MSAEGWLDATRLTRDGLGDRYRAGTPFPHLVIDEAIAADRLAALTEALADEHADRMVDELMQADATADSFATPALQSFVEELQSRRVRGWIKGLTGETTTHVTCRGYAYGPGDYLLPHADADVDASRRVAFVLYVAASDDLVGGELEWFDCHVDRGAIVATIPGGRVAPRPGRLVLFGVGDTTLHQIREVLAGRRVSIAGWFRR